MSPRLSAAFVAVVVAALVAASPADAALSDDVAAGESVATQLKGGASSCDRLSDADAKYLGEYLMNRTVGSRAAHEAMNRRMTQTIGAENTDRMHELMGERFAGCATGYGAGGVQMGPGMMDGSGSVGGVDLMHGSDWSWVRDSSWQQMSQPRWRQLASSMMGNRYASPSHDGWSSAAVVSVVLVTLAGGTALAIFLVRRPRHRPPPTMEGEH